MTTKYDAVIIGGGHNGLVCAYYLARAGKSVRVLERRAMVGGAAVTEEFHPGFRNSVASYTVSLLQPKVIRDMKLARRGLRIVERPVSNFLPQEDGRYLMTGGGMERTQAEFRKFSATDADALPDYLAALEEVADLLRDLALKTPPNAGDGLAALVAAARQGRGVLKRDLSGQREMLALLTKSARTFLDSWFESEAVKAAFGFDAVVGNFASPDTPGSAYVLLHHVFGEVNGTKGAWGHAIGGMGAITQAMRAACEEAGVEISTDAAVEQVLVDNGRAIGVRIEDGREVFGKAIVANVGPRLLYDRLIASDDLPADFRKAMRGYKVGSGTFRVNVALSELPRFACLPEPGEHLQSGIIIAPTLDYMDRAYTDAKQTGMSKAPVVEMLIPTVVDDSLAPAGAHVASLFCQQFAPELPEGRSWDDARDAAADLIVATVDRWAPGFGPSVIARQIHSPLDLERKFGLIGGDIMHGNMSLDQLWSARPVLGNGAYRGPISGLYMCGAGTHPGGGVTGAPGHNAAREILADGKPWRRIARAG
ncbi:FAD-dependent oxidoreductase [Novosphingobium sp. PC22D]|uniref:phytoene desaturase family protein n=1 Tax=Novosphingobium sp. PC22D TaxID=1962403 RepID=UPI000BF23EAA|nr:NAD(P)/FAD-dependent oxidoreductase [Novosphingobium sp. PC22D]PEQ14001.1 FAD-dependent oxidoreductase [Novosphingobium sp. PC22D]